MFDLKSKVVLVTGSSRGIGAAVVKKFAHYGAQTIVHYNQNESHAREVASEIQKASNTSPLLLRADLVKEEDVGQLFREIKTKFGKLNILINNAGISIDGLLPRFKAEDMDRLWQVNLRSAILTSKHAFSLLSKSEHPCVINMSSVVGITGNAGQSIYAATKAGLIALTKSLAKEYASRNIRINAIAPGFIETEMTKSLPEQTRQAYLQNIKLGRFGSPEEIAEICCFLASDLATYVTGQTLVVDGGLTL